jgi:FdhE protein
VPATVLQPGEIEARRSPIPEIRRPAAPSLFAERARRLRVLAQSHSLAGYLEFTARIANAQQAVLDGIRNVSLPPGEQLALATEHGLPPLNVSQLTLDPVWRETLTSLVTLLRQHATVEGRAALARAENMSETELDRAGTELLNGSFGTVDAGIAPLIGAALQVHWTAMLNLLPSDHLRTLDVRTVCPACGSPPVASLVRIGGEVQGLRYLVCSLCAAEWHMVRSKCTHCEAAEGIRYYHVEGASEAVKAETCDACKTYLKVMYMEKEPLVDPVADDLASLSLDLLMHERGYNRVGPNLMLMPGST